MPVEKRCLICGKCIAPKQTIDDCITIGGITEEGDWWYGFALICTLDCFMKFKQRAFKNKEGTQYIFNQN